MCATTRRTPKAPAASYVQVLPSASRGMLQVRRQPNAQTGRRRALGALRLVTVYGQVTGMVAARLALAPIPIGLGKLGTAIRRNWPHRLPALTASVRSSCRYSRTSFSSSRGTSRARFWPIRESFHQLRLSQISPPAGFGRLMWTARVLSPNSGAAVGVVRAQILAIYAGCCGATRRLMPECGNIRALCLPGCDGA